MAYRGRHRRPARRAPLRKFVWARSFGTLPSMDPENGVNLLANFQSEYGAQLVGATVVRIRGLVYFFDNNPLGTGTFHNVAGIIVDSDNEDVTAPGQAVEQREHDDWMFYWPQTQFRNAPNANPDVVATTNAAASPHGVDVKSSRKIEELGQTLWLFRSTPQPESMSLTWHLSIGLKLP